MLPRYPVYVISKGRYSDCMTAKFLLKDDVPFHLVVEPQEREVYARRFGADRILVLPFSNLGMGSIPARNWVKDHATFAGHERHWILDDNILWISRRYKNKRIQCTSGVAFRAIEDFSDRYENVAIAGMNYEMFAIDGQKMPPFYLNHRVYSSMLILNRLPHRWRGRYNEDTDLCLQVLADGLCTVLINAFLIWKMRTMKMKGGNTGELYHGDGRLKMARSLERMWPGVVTTKRRFQRPQHVVDWSRFDTPLKLKEGIKLEELEPNEYGLKLKAVKEVKSERLKKLLQDCKV